MKLTDSGLQDRACWLQNGYKLFGYDRQAMIVETKQNPIWVHFGAGNIFRVFPAALHQQLLGRGLCKAGIIVGEGFDYQIIDNVYQMHDNLTLMVTLKSDGNIAKEVIGSVACAYKLDPRFEAEWEFFLETFRKPSLQMVSFTITEKGYSLRAGNGDLYPAILDDFKHGPKKSTMFLSKLTALVYERFIAKAGSLALVSMDNCSHNGEKLSDAVLTIARRWEDHALVEAGFVNYLENHVSFPWTMIDKITPRPDAKVATMLAADGFEDTSTIITDKNTYTAAFVNAEQSQYLVIEDIFPQGRPPLEAAGVYFTDRNTVNMVERMKVTTCLNPLHTALAIYGCLLGYTRISEEMQDPELRQLVRVIGYQEGMPVVVDPKILNPKDFIDEVLNNRFPNPFLPDTPQRIATDTSQKLAIRFGETVKAYLADENLDVKNLKLIPLVYAGWLRYLMGIDDAGHAFTPSPDPRLAEVQQYVKDLALGCDMGCGADLEVLRPLLQDASIFGLDLYEAGLADLVLQYFSQLIQGVGAVRITLKQHVYGAGK